MKLRNKKTGEIVEPRKLGFEIYSFNERNYSSLAELNEEWEDYKPTEPTEPLIEDEEIREIIRAWANVNDAMVLEYNSDENSLDDIYRNSITFNYGLGLRDGHAYTIPELCGTPPEPIEPTFIDLDGRIKEKEEGC